MMNIDEMKTAWQDYDAKLQSAQSLSDKIIISMIRERSHSRLDRIMKRQIYGLVYLIAMVLLGFAILAGNPFDYGQFVEFVPVSIYTISMISLSFAMFGSLLRLKQIDLSNEDVDSSLKKIIEVYDKPARYFLISLRVLFFSAAVLFPLSFLPRKIVNEGLSHALADTFIPIILSAFILFIAYRLGAFRDASKEKFKLDREELRALKSISDELKPGA